MYKLFNDNWSFALKPIGGLPSNSDYLPVNIPHDWQIYDTRKFYNNGDGFYRKIFKVGDTSHVYSLRFDGVYMDSCVYLNGEKIFEWKYGYTAFDVLLKNLKKGENELVVRVRYESPNTRWYSGAGIFRNVWLRETEESYILPDGTYVVSSPDGKIWHTEIDTEIFCTSDGAVRHTLYDREGNIREKCEAEFKKDEKKVSQRFEIAEPVLWSTDNPYLYTLKTKLIADGKTVDERTEHIGYRTVNIDPNEGFFLNGRHMKLNGVCMHHDLGALGSSVNRAATKRQLEIIKEMGANSVRTSHNPPSSEFMDLCDELGILVDSEGFDMWELKKNDFDYHRFFPEWHERDVRSWIRRDRNRPSVIMWSIGNEIYDTHASPRGYETVKELLRCVGIDDYKHAHAVTIGSNYMRWEPAQKCAGLLDAAGYNYSEDIYDQHHSSHPDWVIYGSETGSTIQSRGVYHFPSEVFTTNYDDGQCSSLLNCATGWGAPNCEYNITADRDRKYSLGQFVWSGFDYIGEPTPYHSKNSFFGHIDTAGFPKDTFYAYKAEWNKDAEPFVHLFPCWDFNEGQLIDVFAFSNCSETELFVNGISAGTFKHDHKNGKSLSGRWQVPYHHGEIRAVGYDADGKKLCEDVKKSFGDPARIILKPNKTVISADGEDMIFVEVSLEDKDGNPVENARNRINIELSGAGRLMGLDNGDSTDYEQYKSASRRLFSGKLLVMIGSGTDTGEILLKAKSEGLPDETLALKCLPAKAKEGISCLDDTFTTENGTEVSLRKIELSVSSQLITPENNTVYVTAELFPKNTTFTDKDIHFKTVTDSGVETNLSVISQNGLKASISARGDGKYRLRAYCKNGTDVEEVISELEMENRGFGPASFNPYGEIVRASIASNGNELLSNMEGGVLTDVGDTSIIFERVDFGAIGSDEIVIGIYTYNEDRIPIELYCDGIHLKTLEFQSKNEWNVYKYNSFKLSEPLKGSHKLEFTVHEKLRFKGFKFKNPRRLGEIIKAIENDDIYGDAFTPGNDVIEHIGNNVILSFNGIDLKDGANAVEITGATHNQTDTLHLRFAGEDPRAVEFKRSEGLTTQRFNIEPIKGIKDLQVIFLPGSDFDLKSLRFLKI